VAPTPPTPSALAVDASEADRAAAKIADDDATAIYNQQVLDYSDALSVYRDDLAAYTQWCDDDAKVADALTLSVLPQFASEFIGLSTSKMWTHLRQRYQPSGDAIYLSVVQHEHALRQCNITIDEFYTQSSFIWPTPFSLLYVVLAHVSTWSFNASMSSCLDFVVSLSFDVLSCLLGGMFLF
jgi:hypothetical protein